MLIQAYLGEISISCQKIVFAILDIMSLMPPKSFYKCWIRSSCSLFYIISLQFLATKKWRVHGSNSTRFFVDEKILQLQWLISHNASLKSLYISYDQYYCDKKYHQPLNLCIFWIVVAIRKYMFSINFVQPIYYKRCGGKITSAIQ